MKTKKTKKGKKVAIKALAVETIKDVKLPPFKVEKVVSTFSQTEGWGVKQLNVPETWKTTRGEGITIMIIDTGFSDHPDLGDAILKDKCKSFLDYEENIEDRNGHSTHCTGIAAARDNEEGMVGVAPKCNVITCKTLGADGSGSMNAVAEALEYAIQIKPDVISMSLGSPEGTDRIHNAIKELYRLNIPVVAAAGNSGLANDVNYPGKYPEVICVTAYGEDGKPAYFNSIGPEVDVSAPGVNIYSTWLNHSYAKLSGTCLSGKTLVYTDTGVKYITDIKAGDMVYTLNEDTLTFELDKVMNVLCNGVKKTYKLKTNHETIYATDNHPFLIIHKEAIEGKKRKRYEYSLRWKELKDLKKGDEIITPKHFNEVYSLDRVQEKLNIIHDSLSKTLTKNIPPEAVKITPDLCQFIGAYLGDGYIYHNDRALNTRAGIGLCIYYGYKQLNKDLPDRYNNIFKRAFGEDFTRDDKGSLFKYSQYIANVIGELGLDHKAHDKRIPEWCFTLPREYIMRIISGLIDTDGWKLQNGNLGFEFCNRLLLEDIKRLCHSVGLVFSNIIEKSGITNFSNNKMCNSYSMISTKIKDFADELNIQDQEYIKSLLNRKKTWKRNLVKSMISANYIKYLDKFKVEKIRSIETGSEELVYDLTICNNHNFIANGIVVHNSMATPFFAGVVALLLAKHRKQEKETGLNDCKTVDQIKDHISKYSDDKGVLGKDDTWGYGMVDPVRLITEDTTTTTPITSSLPINVPAKKKKKSWWRRLLGL